MLKKSELSFIRNLFISSLIILLLSFYPIYVYASKGQVISFAYAYIIGLVNVLIGFGCFEIAMSKDLKKFMLIIFSGMFIRVFLCAALLILVIYHTTANTTALIASFFVFYFVFTIMEIKYIHKKKAIGVK